MTDLRKAAEMALEYLDCAITHNEKKVKAALKEALTQPGQEPVAWICKKNGKRWLAWNSTEHVPSFSTMEPLYRHPATIPEGWQLVPIEPTKEMSDTFWSAYIPAPDGIAQSCSFEDFHDFRYMYKAMLAAAPKPEDV